MMLFTVVVVAVVVGCLPPSVHGQVFFTGNCPSTPILKNFNFDRYLGRWYEQERFFLSHQEALGQCWTGTYTKDANGKITFTVNFRDSIENAPSQINMEIKRKRPLKQPNRLTYTIRGLPFFQENYEVLDTDYQNWTLEYGCEPKPPFGHLQTAWILTRSKNPHPSIIATAKQRLKSIGINADLLRKQDSSCAD